MDQSTTMTILVTGGNGLLGSNVIEQLLQRNYRVRAFLRPNRNLPITHDRIEKVYGNLVDRNHLADAMQGCDAVIHMAAYTGQDSDAYADFEQVNVCTTQLIIQVANECAVRRVIYVSSANTFGHGTLENPGNESLPFRYPFSKSGYSRSKQAAQQYALEFNYNHSTSVVVVNPGFMLGAYDSKPSSGAIILWAYRKRIIFYPPGGKSFIHVRDAADAVCNSLTRGRHGQCYLLVNENMSYRAFFKKVCAITGQRSILVALPAFLLKTLGVLGSALLTLGVKNNFHSINTSILCEANYYSNAKATQELGLKKTPISVAIEDAIEWFQQTNRINTIKK